MRHLLLPSAVLTLALTGCTDKGGGDDTGDGGIVDENTAPTAPEVTIAPDGPGTASDLTATIVTESTDADGDPVTYTYAWTLDGVDAPEHTTDTVPASATAKGQTWAVTVTPDDGTDSGEAGTASTTVLNTPPVTASATAGPDPATAADTLTCTSGGATDADDDTVTETVAWYADDVEVGTGETLAPGPFGAGDSVWCVITPDDGEDAGEPVTSNVLVIDNQAPVGDSLDVTPADVYTDTLVTAEAAGTDPDGDTVTFTYRWTVDGAEAGTDSTLDGATAFDKGDVIQVTATPSDGATSGEPLVSAEITVLNTPPEGTRADLSPTEPVTTDDIVADVDGTDADGDTLEWTYRWYVNDAEVGASGPTLPAARTVRGDEIYVVATPDDGEDAGSSVTSDTVTVGNSPPVGTRVTLSSYSVTTNEVLVADPVGTDGDDDSLSWTYAWYVDGELVSGVSGASLDGASYFDKGQEVYVTATPNDGVEDGTPVSSDPAEVINSAPSAPGVVVEPAEPFTDEDLFCTLDSASTDADGDDIDYRFTWTVDGEEYTDASTTTWEGDTVPASATAGDEEWVCTITPADDEEDGTAGSDSVTILDWDGARIFTTCGATGRTGPAEADCDTEYGDTTLDGEVTVTDGIQTWTVPADGDYVITAYGAQGASGDSDWVGGWGALAEGTFTLAEGDVLYIVVGQEGTGQSSGSDGGGAGGSFVVDIDETPLVVAGGGSGTRDVVDQDGCDGVGDEYGVEGSGGSTTSSCTVKTTDLGLGGVISSWSWGSGGAGFYGDGESERDTYSSWGGDGGNSWENGMTGGEGNDDCGISADGGFGGGGAGDGCYGGGGGGGYSGGDGGRVAGGGGSWVDDAASDVTRTTGYNEGEGWVTIDRAD